MSRDTLEVAGNQKYMGIIWERVLFYIFRTSYILAIIRVEYSRGIFVNYSDEYSGGYSGDYSGEYTPRIFVERPRGLAVFRIQRPAAGTSMRCASVVPVGQI